MANQQAAVPHLPPSHHKISEKLVILNDRGTGLLIRLYNIRRMLSNDETKPPVFQEKTYEAGLKFLSKKFPQCDLKAKELQPFVVMREDLIQRLSMYYFTFVDIMDFRDHVADLLTRIDVAQVHFDINVNFELTRLYLELISTHIAMQLLLARIETRRQVVALFNLAHEAMSEGNKGESHYPRLANMLNDYGDAPLKKLSEDFVPHNKMIAPALASLRALYQRRAVRADALRAARVLSLLAEPNALAHLNTSLTETVHCEFLSLDAIERWIILIYSVCYLLLNGEEALQLWKQALSSCWAVTLCRDEALAPVHATLIELFSGLRGFGKRTADLKEWANIAFSQAPAARRDKRRYYRTALRELVLVLDDQPGLLGPKAVMLLMALAYARDEVAWYVRHAATLPGVTALIGKQAAKLNANVSDELTDRQLPELLCYIEELRGLVRKYANVIQRYYIQFLKESWSYALSQTIQYLPLAEDEAIIFTSFIQELSALNVSQAEASGFLCGPGTPLDFRGLRLDWLRMQASMSSARSNVQLRENARLASHLNTIALYTRLIDELEPLLQDTSDLSLFCFQLQLLETAIHQCIEFPAQHRYLSVFAQLCTHFVPGACHELCPEERTTIGMVADHYAWEFIRALCDEIADLVFKTFYAEHGALSRALLPKQAIHSMTKQLMAKKGKKGSAKEKESASSGAKSGRGKPGAKDAAAEPEKPGAESYRRNREEFTKLDRLQMALTELSTAVGRFPLIQVYERGYIVAERLNSTLETHMTYALVQLLELEPDAPFKKIARPSEYLSSVQTLIDMLQSLETHVQVDMTRVLSTSLQQQSQQRDGIIGEDTVAKHYMDFYFDLLRRAVSHLVTPGIVYVPGLRGFVSVTLEAANVPPAAASAFGLQPAASVLAAMNAAPPAAGDKDKGQTPLLQHCLVEHYMSWPELVALAEILGVYGVRSLSEKLIVATGNQIEELKKLIGGNRDVLRLVRQSYEQPERMRDIVRTIKDADTILQRVNCIGILLAFRSLLLDALSEVLDRRSPFLMASIRDFRDHVPPVNDSLIVSELCSSSGLRTAVDPILAAGIKKYFTGEDDFEMIALLLVCVSVTLPRLADSEYAIYVPQLQCLLNNMHCMAIAIPELTRAALFTLAKPGALYDLLSEFLALASASVLRFGEEQSDEKSAEAGASLKANYHLCNRDSLYVLLHMIVESCEKRGAGISTSMFERCFPYVLLRNAYRALHKQLVASAAPPAAATGAARGQSPAESSARSDAAAAAGDQAAAAAALASQNAQMGAN